MLSAVVCPLTLREAPRALENLQVWDREFPPLTEAPGTSAQPPTLIFSFAGAQDDQIKHEFSSMFDKLPAVRHSFDHLEVRFCNLSPEKDIYVRDGDTQYAPYGRKAGPNWLFYETVRSLQPDSKYIFLMETDCRPIVSNWLRRLQRLSLQHDDAWVVGSHYCGVSPLHWSVVRHINGNALYNLGDPSFWQFFSEEFWPWFKQYVVSHAPGLAYDCGWETFLNRIEMEHSANYDWIKVRNVLQRFRLSTFVVNLGGHAEQSGDYIWTRNDVLKRYPNAVLVHGPLSNNTAHRRGNAGVGKPCLDGSVDLDRDKLKVICDSLPFRFSRSIWLIGEPFEEADDIVVTYVLDCSTEAGVTVSVADPSGRIMASMRRIGANEGEPCTGRMSVTIQRRLPYVKLVFVFGGPMGAGITLSDVRAKISRNNENLALVNRILQD